MSNQLEKIKELIDRRTAARLGGGEKAIAKQHEKGKYTARERIAMLLDEGSSKKWTCLLSTDVRISVWKRNTTPATVWLPVAVPSTVAWSTFRTGFHCFCRFIVGNHVFENLQNHGSSNEDGCSLYRYQ